MRKIKYHVATTLDGFIAHRDHTVGGFVEAGEHVTDYLDSLKNDYDVVLMGVKRMSLDFNSALRIHIPG